MKLGGLFFEAFWNTCRGGFFWTRSRLADHAMDGSAGSAIGLGELAEALPLMVIAQDAAAIELEGFAADVTAFELGAAHAGAHPLDDEIAFEFRNGADNHHHCPTQRAAGIDLLAKADELDVQMIQLIENFEEVFDGPGQPIGGPDQNHIEAAAAGIGHHLIQTRTPGFGTGDLVCILLDDLIVALSGHLLEIVQLGLRVLIQGGDSQVEGGALHGGHKTSISYV